VLRKLVIVESGLDFLVSRAIHHIRAIVGSWTLLARLLHFEETSLMFVVKLSHSTRNEGEQGEVTSRCGTVSIVARKQQHNGSSIVIVFGPFRVARLVRVTLARRPHCAP